MVRVDPPVPALPPALRRPQTPAASLHLDLLALLAFSVSFFVFSAGNVSLSVPLPTCRWVPLRAHAARRLPTARSSERLIPYFSDTWLLAGIVVLMAARIGLALFDSTVLDVGAAGVAGAHVLLHGNQLYNGGLGRTSSAETPTDPSTTWPMCRLRRSFTTISPGSAARA